MLRRFNTGSLRRLAAAFWIAASTILAVPVFHADRGNSHGASAQSCHGYAPAVMYALASLEQVAAGALSGDADKTRSALGVPHCCLPGCGILTIPEIAALRPPGPGVRIASAADDFAEGLRPTGPARPPRTTDIADLPA